MTNGVVPPNNIGPRSINGGAGLNQPQPYETLRTSAIDARPPAAAASEVFCGPADDPFFADLGAIFDLAGLRPGQRHRWPCAKNCHSIALSIPIATLQKTGQPVSAATNILDPNYVIGVWASASRQQMHTFSTATGDGAQRRLGAGFAPGHAADQRGHQPHRGKDAWNARTPYNEAAVTDDYLSNPELGLYMADDMPVAPRRPKPAADLLWRGRAGAECPAHADQVAGRLPPACRPNGFDFRNQADGLFPLKGSPGWWPARLWTDAAFGNYLLVAGKPRSVDIKPIFHTGVPNLPPYQLATGKTPLRATRCRPASRSSTTSCPSRPRAAPTPAATCCA